jgi:transposase
MKPYKYVIELTDEEREALQCLIRSGKTERRIADRARIILWADEGVAIDESAYRLGCHRSTVIYWWARFLERRSEGIPTCLQDLPRSGRPLTFSPQQVAQAKAVACERPSQLGLPLSRFSISEVRNWIVGEEIVEAVSLSTVWRWLHQDAIRPWFYHSWLFPRDPRFLEKAGPVLDLYQGLWQGESLEPNDYVISADEKSQLQALGRPAPTLAPIAQQVGHFEYEYIRGGALAYLAALDVFSGQVFGRVDKTTGVEPFNKLVHLVMRQEPYAQAKHVFWIVDNGSSHHPNTFPARLQTMYPNAIAVMLPVHASWLNQIELYFSILQRKALTPNDLPTLQALAERILGFQERYDRTAKPFRWNFTRNDLKQRMKQLDDP